MPLDTSTYALSLLRLDGRRWNELRRMSGSLSTQAAADGSSYLEVGNTKVLCTVSGPAEIRNASTANRGGGGGGGGAGGEDRAGVHVTISVAGFSGTDRRPQKAGAGAAGGGGGGDRRVTEMQSTVQQTLSSALFLERYPRSTISVACHVLAADGGVLAACLNAATLALVDAGIPMGDYVCACSAGSTANTLAYVNTSSSRQQQPGGGGGQGGGGDAAEDADPLLDLNAQEELELPFLTVATLGASERVACLAMETRVRLDRVESMLAVAVDGCKQIREILDGIVKRHGRQLLANSVG